MLPVLNNNNKKQFFKNSGLFWREKNLHVWFFETVFFTKKLSPPNFKTFSSRRLIFFTPLLFLGMMEPGDDRDYPIDLAEDGSNILEDFANYSTDFYTQGPPLVLVELILAYRKIYVMYPSPIFNYGFKVQLMYGLDLPSTFFLNRCTDCNYRRDYKFYLKFPKARVCYSCKNIQTPEFEFIDDENRCGRCDKNAHGDFPKDDDGYIEGPSSCSALIKYRSKCPTYLTHSFKVNKYRDRLYAAELSRVDFTPVLVNKRPRLF